MTEMLVRHLGCRGDLTVDATSLDDLLSKLDVRYPGFRDSICDEAGRIRIYVNLFLNGQLVAHDEPRALSAGLSEGDEVHILASIAGGAGW
jgi:sulfur-carrier protein